MIKFFPHFHGRNRTVSFRFMKKIGLNQKKRKPDKSIFKKNTFSDFSNSIIGMYSYAVFQFAACSNRRDP